jgi:hypothetical protein
MNSNPSPLGPVNGAHSDGVLTTNGAVLNGHHESQPDAATFQRPGFGGRPGADYRDLDYRALDYRATDYRGLQAEEEDGEGIDWAAAAWRYRYALILPALVGMALAAALFTTRPTYYRSTARLVVESDRPTVLDADSGDVISGVPPADLLLMQLQSEQVLDHAARNPLMAEAAASMSRQELLEVLSLVLVCRTTLPAARKTQSPN